MLDIFDLCLWYQWGKLFYYALLFGQVLLPNGKYRRCNQDIPELHKIPSIVCGWRQFEFIRYLLQLCSCFIFVRQLLISPKHLYKICQTQKIDIANIQWKLSHNFNVHCLYLIPKLPKIQKGPASVGILSKKNYSKLGSSSSFKLESSCLDCCYI